MITKTKSNNISNGLRIIITLSSVLVFFLLLSCEPVKTHPIKVVFIPQGQFKTEKINGSDTLHNVSISVDAFYMSNEITNKEYREFTDWARKNPDETLWFPKYVPREVKDPKTGKMRNVIFKIPDIIKVSDILPSLMDSTALFKLDKKYKNYFTDKRYNDYPVVGVSMKAAEYFCIWKTFSEVIITKTDSGFITTQINHDYRLPLETEWEYVAQQPYDKQVTNFDSKVLHKSNEGNANIWDLLHFNDNVSEWVSSPEEKNGIVRGGSWQTEAGIIERSVIDPNSTEGYIGFRIVRSYSSPEQNK